MKMSDYYQIGIVIWTDIIMWKRLRLAINNMTRVYMQLSQPMKQ